MESVIDYARQYSLVIVAVAAVLLLAASWKSKKVREWVVRLTVFALVVAAGYFIFQKFGYLIPSQAPMTVGDEQQTPREHAGHKYYQDPEERIQE